MHAITLELLGILLASSSLHVPVLTTQPLQDPAAGQPAAVDANKVALMVGRSQQLTSEWAIKGVSLTDPAVADVQLLTPQLLLVSGKGVGTTDALLWGETGQTRMLRIEVAVELSSLQQGLSDLFSDARLELSQSQSLTVVTGVLARAEQAEQMHAWFAGLGVKYVDMTRVAGVQQVQLKVRMAEASRTSIRTLGINGYHAGEDLIWGSTIGSSGGGPLNPVSIGPPEGSSAVGNIPFEFTSDVAVSPAVTLFAAFPNSDLQVFVQALAENQYLRILAEPNLVALSGAEANFLAGGEFPIPISQNASAGTASITVEYKEFGIALKFKPVVLGDNTIRLQVASEVSDLTDIGAVELQGFRIPALITRRAATTLEMRSGQTFAMAGLLSQSTNAQASRVPGLGDVPLLGALFRSARYKSGETELVVLVSASLVEPLSDGTLPLPGEDHIAPSDWELYALGQIEGRAPARTSADNSAWIKSLGLERIKGPGAWATHEQGRAASTATVSITSAEPATASPAGREQE